MHHHSVDVGPIELVRARTSVHEQLLDAQAWRQKMHAERIRTLLDVTALVASASDSERRCGDPIIEYVT
jgi:hypothetical protein